MDKTQALQQITDLEAKVAELRKIVEAPEPAKSLLTKPVPGSGTRYHVLTPGPHGRLIANHREAYSGPDYDYSHGNFFQTYRLAAAYADAFNTFLLLRHQPGAVPASNVRQTTLRVDAERNLDTMPSSIANVKMGRLSPAFDTEASALRAIEVVGADKILAMFKTFHGL